MLPGKRYTPEDVARIAWRRKWLIAAPVVAATLVAVVALRYVPDLYRSDTLILVVPQRVPESYVQSTVTARIEDRLQSITQQILSRSRLEPLIEEFNLYVEERKTRPMEDVVDMMRLDIVAEPVRGDAFRVSYVSRSPVLAQKVTERLASLFIEENLRDREVLADATNEFLESQLNEARERLVQHEKRLEAYRLRYAGELPSQAQSNLQALQTLQMQVQGLTDSVARDRDRRLMLERQLGELQRQSQTPGTPGSTTAELGEAPQGTAEQQLAAAKRLLEALESRLTPEHPDVIRTRRQIADLEVKAREERAELAKAAAAAASTAVASDAVVAATARTTAERAVAELRGALATVTREITSKEDQLSRLQREIDDYRSRLSAVPTRESEMTGLMRDYDTLRAVYTDLLAKRENSKVAANLERRQIGEQFRVLDAAHQPERPFSPNRPLVTAGGAVAGLVLGLAFIALLELRDSTYHRDDDVTQALGLPVLALVPRMLNPVERRRRQVRTVAYSSAAIVSAVVVAGFVAYRIWL